jgi:hypothetical protein
MRVILGKGCVKRITEQEKNKHTKAHGLRTKRNKESSLLNIGGGVNVQG